MNYVKNPGHNLIRSLPYVAQSKNKHCSSDNIQLTEKKLLSDIVRTGFCNGKSNQLLSALKVASSKT